MSPPHDAVGRTRRRTEWIDARSSAFRMTWMIFPGIGERISQDMGLLPLVSAGQ